MTKRISKIASSLKQLGDIQVNDWDFMALLNKDIGELEVARTLRRLGNIRVNEWDFHKPAIAPATAESDGPGHSEMQALVGQLKNFLQYVATALIDDPEQARLVVTEIEHNVLRLKLVLTQRDVASLIGHGGHTAAAIRNLVKAVAARHDVHALLEIVSHDVAAARDTG